MNRLPRDTLQVIASFLIEPVYSLLEWIDPNNLDTGFLSTNPNAIDYLEQHPSQINWTLLNANPHPRAIQMLEKNPHKICWSILSGNPSAIHMIEKNIDKVDWDFLSENPNAIHLIEKNNIRHWSYLSRNPNAIHLLKDNVDKIDFDRFITNPKAMSIIKDNQHRMKRSHWILFSKNPSIFVVDTYKTLQKAFTYACELEK